MELKLGIYSFLANWAVTLYSTIMELKQKISSNDFMRIRPLYSTIMELKHDRGKT